ncbi:putative protein-disulfide isomerase [Actimicrobium sp. GrIS 1.19]|uniref:DsbA family protein n=1 Tax=Actimicrobium sp. GrIS 1.19 TaxID=3071708 RepID=UPI002DFA970D|nr:putative protein-disulfide isomerase [Actimicrobium sp. GrIS 1.19]
MTKLIYIADPMCSWCYGFGPELSALLDGLPGLRVEIVLGGLRAYNDAVMDEVMRTELMAHWQKVHDASGLAFSDQTVMQENFIYNTEPACRAVVAARQWAPDATMAVFQAIQQAFYVDGRDVTRAEVLAEVCSKALTAAGAPIDAAGAPIDAAAFAALWESDEIKQATHADFAQTRHWNITGFPTLVLERDGALDMVTSGFTAMPKLVEQLQALVDRQTAA